MNYKAKVCNYKLNPSFPERFFSIKMYLELFVRKYKLCINLPSRIFSLFFLYLNTKIISVGFWIYQNIITSSGMIFMSKYSLYTLLTPHIFIILDLILYLCWGFSENHFAYFRRRLEAQYTSQILQGALAIILFCRKKLKLMHFKRWIRRRT